MTIPSATAALERLGYVTDAGAAPTDNGDITCFQVKLSTATEMNDVNESEVRETIRTEMEGELNGSLTIQSSKDVLEEETDQENCCFWVYVFGSFGSFTKGGIEYKVVYWNPDWGVDALPVGRAEPGAVEAERFKWEDVSITVEELEE